MAQALREATLYRESGKKNAGGANILTRGKTHKEPDAGLRGKAVDILAGRFWVANLPDLTRNNEAYLEVTAVTLKGDIRVPHPFKLETKVRDETFSADIQGVQMITAAEVIGTGIEFQCRLTEMDKIDEENFSKLKTFVDSNDIPGVAQALLNASGLPLNPKEALKIFFNTVSLIDELNDDDRVWKERPKLDLRPGIDNPLYEGWYALVSTPRGGATKLPVKLFESGGALYKKFNSDDDNEPFDQETYFTWQIIASWL